MKNFSEFNEAVKYKPKKSYITVDELINELQKVKRKSAKVHIFGEHVDKTNWDYKILEIEEIGDLFIEIKPI